MSDEFHEYNLKVRVGSFHRAYNLRPIGGWFDNTYHIEVKCRVCKKKQEHYLNNYEITLKCPNCYFFFPPGDHGNLTIVSNFIGPQSINEEGVWVTVMKVNLAGPYFTLVPEVELNLIKWSCKIEKKNEHDDTLARSFYLERGGFYESSHWDSASDSDEMDSVDSDSSSGGWDSDDSDRPCIKNVTARFEPDD